MKNSSKKVHPKGEYQKQAVTAQTDKIPVDTFDGKVYINWDHNATVTPLGQLAFFIEFLKQTGLFDDWIDQCPLKLTSNNASATRDILGTILLSVLSGHTRYAHMMSVRTDKVNAPLLGMKKIVSEDSVRRALLKMPELESKTWLMNSLKNCYEELLTTPWILDVDTTVKCLYGHQEGAVVGYNPQKPGRPSHTYHTYMMANIRLILDVEVMPGNESSPAHTSPHLFSWLDTLEKNKWPNLMRGDCAFGTDEIMKSCEQRKINYLFKLKQTPVVKRFIATKMIDGEWENAGQGWHGAAGEIQLSTWKSARKSVVLRRKLSKDVGIIEKNTLSGQRVFQFADMGEKFDTYEYAVLVTNLDEEILTLAYHYRDRADCENNFDELKNQWGWSGYTTSDLHRCRLMAKIIALIYNWWTIFVRLIEPNRHMEAITSRPLLLNTIGKMIQHAGQKIIQVASSHAKFKKIQGAIISLSEFFKTFKSSADQLTLQERMRRVLYRAFEKFITVILPEPQKLLQNSS